MRREPTEIKGQNAYRQRRYGFNEPPRNRDPCRVENGTRLVDRKARSENKYFLLEYR